MISDYCYCIDDVALLVVVVVLRCVTKEELLLVLCSFVHLFGVCTKFYVDEAIIFLVLKGTQSGHTNKKRTRTHTWYKKLRRKDTAFSQVFVLLKRMLKS